MDEGIELDEVIWTDISSTEGSNESSVEFNELYKLTDEVLGTGGYSEVFVGFRIEDNKKVAIKVMSTKLIQTPFDEVDILKKLWHKNIIRFFDFFEYTTESLLVMECLDGGELLNRIISKCSYDENIAREAAINALHGLKHCHSLNIIHRDLKPDNLLLRSTDDDADLVLADFGMAIELPPEGFILSPIVGTPGYIAPEILMFKPYSKPADMWSFGVTLYILLIGQFPFETDSQATGKDLQFHEEELLRISEDASHLLRSLLKPNPAERLTVEQALSHPWMQKPATFLLERDLSSKLPALKSFLARRKFKGGVHAIIATQKFSAFSARIRQQQQRDREREEHQQRQQQKQQAAILALREERGGNENENENENEKICSINNSHSTGVESPSVNLKRNSSFLFPVPNTTKENDGSVRPADRTTP